MYRTTFIIGFLCSVVVLSIAVVSGDDKDKSVSDAVLDVVELKGSDVNESSGLAVSNRKAKRWWTHNDSGGKPRLYAYSHKGKRTGKCDLEDVKARDWEDMASYEIEGRPKLIVADTGDNLAQRKSVWLYLFDEPDPSESTDVNRIERIQVTYPDGPRDCEAIAVNTATKKIVLIEKAKFPYAGVYTVDIPVPSARPTPIEIVAERIGTLNIPMVSAMDIDPANGDIWVVNYFQAFRFPRSGNQQDLAKQVAVLPETFDLPKWRQIEAVAVDKEHGVWLTSEGKDAPLGRLNLDRK